MDHWTRVLLFIVALGCCGNGVTSTVLNLTRINAGDLSKQNYSIYTELHVMDSNLSTLTREDLLQMKTIGKLSFVDGTVPTYLVTPQFVTIDVDKCHTKNVIISQSDTYQLKRLEVTRNELTKIPKNLNALKRLEQLHLWKNNIEYVDEVIDLPELKEISLSSNRLTKISFKGWKANSLIALSLKNNTLVSVPEQLNVFENIMRLYLDHNEIGHVDMTELTNLGKLEVLHLNNNEISDIHSSSDETINLPELKEICLNSNRLTKLSFKDWNANSLSRIQLENNKLATIPESLNNFKHLKRLDLDSNQIKYVDMVRLTNLENLTVLYLSENQIININSTMAEPINVPKLKKINLHSNRLTKLSFKHWNAGALTEIYLGKNKLVAVPEKLNMFTNLEKLELNDNEIEYVDLAELKDLANLETLLLHNNRILEISSSNPDPINLLGLKTVFTHSNRLTDFSIEHWNVTAGKYIQLNSRYAFPMLTEVRIDHNPLSCWWSDAILKELDARNVSIQHKNEVKCNETSITIQDLKAMKLDDQSKKIVDYLQRQQSKLTDLVHSVNQLKVEHNICKQIIEQLQARLQTFEGQSEQTDARNATQVEEKIHKVEVEMRRKVGAMFGAWLFTSSGCHFRVEWVILWISVLSCFRMLVLN